MGKDYVDANRDYWDEYSNLQHVKHELIRHYLNGWFPKLATWAGEVLYFDTHAGRGKHRSGQLGSPLVALDTLLTHSYLPELLPRCQFRFVFMERDQENFDALEQELAGRRLPQAVTVDPRTGDCFEHLRRLVDTWPRAGVQRAPAFVFVDPYGFKIPGGLLRDLMQAGPVELFVNVMWREIHMGLGHARNGHDGWVRTFDYLFAGGDWRSLWKVDDRDTMGDQAVELLAAQYGARWSTPFRMLDRGGQTRYMLMHLSNHDYGRDLMKKCMWKVSPEGDFSARKSTGVGQQFLFEADPDLGELRAWTIDRLTEGHQRWSALEKALLDELWLNKHLREVLRALRRDKIVAGESDRRFTSSADPLLRLLPQSQNLFT